MIDEENAGAPEEHYFSRTFYLWYRLDLPPRTIITSIILFMKFFNQYQFKRGEAMELNKKSKTILSFSLLSALFMTTQVFAHHSLVGEYDTSKSMEVRGKITKLEWTNPHIWVYLDVTTADGKIEQWQCEMGSPNQLVRGGWKKEDLPVGTVIRASANPARSDPHICSTRRITTDDGKPIFTRGAQ